MTAKFGLKHNMTLLDIKGTDYFTHLVVEGNPWLVQHTFTSQPIHNEDNMISFKMNGQNKKKLERKKKWISFQFG